MKKSFLRVISLIFSLLLCTCSVSAASNGSMENFKKVNKYQVGEFVDVSLDEWYAESIKTAFEYGFMKGSSDATFNPSGNITIAETIAIASRLHSIYYNNNYSFKQDIPWYDVYVQYAISYGIINNGEIVDYNTYATRQQFAKIIASALPVEVFSEINNIIDNSIPDVKLTDEAGTEIYILYRAGILTGNDKYGTFEPNTKIDRSSVSAIISRIADINLRQRFVLESYTKSIKTLDELEKYLNQNMSSCITPLGTYQYKFSIRERTYDFVIETSHIDGNPWYELKESDSISDNIKEETLSILRNFQKDVYEIASTAFPDKAIAGGFCDWEYKYPNIKADPYVITALSWANHSYSGEDEFYSFYWETSRDWYDFNSNEEDNDVEKDISTIAGLENYLNNNMNSCETPMGTFSLKFTVEENSYSFNGWDIEIKTQGNYCVLPWADISSSIKYSDEEKEETINTLRNLQISIYEVACKAFPDKKLTGCYFSDWYKYSSINVGYKTSRHLTWTNYSSDGYAHDYNSTYITSFHWDSWRDDATYE